jgi:DNA replication and repair protein RecF
VHAPSFQAKPFIVSTLPSYAITRLTLTDFRNYAVLRLEPEAKLVALAGANGSGKTNLLEALSLLSPGRGLRGAEFAQIARQNGGARWAVSAHCQCLGDDVQIGTAWQQPDDEAAKTARSVVIDGLPQRAAASLGKHMRLLWLTPAMDRLFMGSPGERRRFLDRMVALLYPDHAAHVAAFERVMRERNALLQEPDWDAAWITSLELQMAEAGAAIAHARLDAVAVLGLHFGAAAPDSLFPWGRIAVDGETEALAGSRPAVQAEDDYRQILARNRAADRGAGRALSGPHRSDLIVSHGPKNMPAQLCSTGEQKALLIGLILAQARAVQALVGGAPMLLLDEVAAHLDKARRIGLFARLEALATQVWMTATDTQLFDGIGGSAVVYEVHNGSLSESKIIP